MKYLTIAIDDVNPKKDWRIFGDKTEKFLFDLNREYGVKFTLFIPSNHHGDAPLSENKNWINELISAGIFELAAHGHFHQTSDKARFGEMEFADMKEWNECSERLKMLFGEWEQVGVIPKGWRNPGWICQPFCVPYLSENFKWVALHYDHNQGMKWGCKMVFGADGINETNIMLHEDNIMFQSHIFGDWNKNIWNQENYDQLRLSLDYLIDVWHLKYSTISECLGL